MPPTNESGVFGPLLKRHRLAAGLTQEVLAERAGMSARTISDLERGINCTPRRDTLELLADALGLRPEERLAAEAVARRPSRGPPGAKPRGSTRSMGAGVEEREAVPGLRVRLFGSFRLAVGDRAINVDGWKSRKGKSLVKMLALAQNHRLPRDHVIELLWPDAEPGPAINRLHQIVHGIRSALLAPGVLRFQDEMLVLHPIWSDVEAFEAAAATAFRLQDVAAYHTALDLYAGDLLPEDRYEDWCRDRRESLREERLRLLLGAGRLYEAQQEFDSAIDALRQALAMDSVYEEAHVALMRIYSCSGRRQLSLRQYQVLQDSLRRELETEPQASSRQLYEDILAGRFPPAKEDRLPREGFGAQTEGAEGAMRSAKRVPPYGQDQRAALNNLPVHASSFIGRVHEQEQVSNLLKTTRLLTLAGPGGCGKTRLAVQVAAALQGTFPDGVWLVNLAPLHRPSLVPQAVMSALGLSEQPGCALTETLVAGLQSSRMLLLLDNCEHLICACASLVEMLLDRCPHLRILTTSREPLHILGEVTWQVRSLSLADPDNLPPIEDLLRFEAIELFVERARERHPSFTVTAESAPALARICYRLDGMPLALELAAARVRVLSVDQIEGRLSDWSRLLTGGSRTAPSRQQTLKATLDWSYDLLSSEEKTLFRRLAVFAGSFGLDAVEVVGAGDGTEPADVLDLLTKLVDKSLVEAEQAGGVSETRYRLLETVRQYALSALETSKEEVTVRQRHRDYYLRLSEQANAGLWTDLQDQSLQVLGMEQDNLRAALTWCASYGEAEAALMLSRALWQFWLLRGQVTEGRHWLADALSAAPVGTSLRAELLRLSSALTARKGDLEAARALVEESMAISRATNDRHGCVEAILLHGTISFLQFDYKGARAEFEEGLALATGLEAELAVLTHSLGFVLALQGNYQAARALLEESLGRFQAVGDQPRPTSLFLNLAWTVRDGLRYGHAAITTEDTWVLLREIGSRACIGYVLANLGNLARIEGDHDLAEHHLQESLSVFRALGDRAGITQVLAQLGNLATSTRDYIEARVLLEESLALRQAMGDRRGIGRTLSSLGNLARAEGNLGSAKALYEEAMALFEAMADRPGRAWLLNDLVHFAMGEGDYCRARAFNEQLAAQFAELGDSGRGQVLSLTNLGILAQLEGDNTRAKSCFRESIARFEEQDDRRTVAALLCILAEIAQDEGDHACSRALFAESMNHYQRAGDKLAVAAMLAKTARAG